MGYDRKTLNLVAQLSNNKPKLQYNLFLFCIFFCFLQSQAITLPTGQQLIHRHCYWFPFEQLPSKTEIIDFFPLISDQVKKKNPLE